MPTVLIFALNHPCRLYKSTFGEVQQNTALRLTGIRQQDNMLWSKYSAVFKFLPTDLD